MPIVEDYYSFKKKNIMANEKIKQKEITKISDSYFEITKNSDVVNARSLVKICDIVSSLSSLRIVIFFLAFIQCFCLMLSFWLEMYDII